MPPTKIGETVMTTVNVFKNTNLEPEDMYIQVKDILTLLISEDLVTGNDMINKLNHQLEV